MSEAVVAQKSPYAVAVEAGKTYYWCACGRSKGQPYCDGSHRGSGITPVEFRPTETGTVYLCGCKRTGKQPHCDGTHRGL